MRDVMGVPYVIAPDVLADQKPVSVNLVMPRADLPMKVVGFLRSLGLVVKLSGGTVFVSHKPLAQVGGAVNMPSAAYAMQPMQASVSQAMAPTPATPSGSPFSAGPSEVPALSQSPVSAVADEPVGVVAVIEPAHRSPVELADMVRAVLPGLSIAVREASQPQGSQIVDRLEPSVLVLSGTKSQISMASQLVRAVDRPRAAVAIKAVLFEVRTSKARGSALSLLSEVLGGRVGLGINPGGTGGDQFVKIATGGVSAVLSAVRTDGRFQIVAEPSLSALSGATATINSGSQVPTIGEVTYTDNGQPIRSVVYRDSGVSLTVTPTVRRGEIEMRVLQERSTFSRTETGVNDTPTLNKSTASSVVAIRPGETVAIAGLDERSDNSTRDGFFGGLLGSRQRDQGSSQLLLLVQADLAADGRQAAPAIEVLEDRSDEAREGAAGSRTERSEGAEPVVRSRGSAVG
ncbi:type II secretion system protein GspD [Novosphingobium sp. 11B]